MGRLLLVRHGESVWNRDAIVQGQAGPGLSPLGHEQASATARWLVEELRARHDGTTDDVVFVSSDLERCTDTAAPIASLLGREPALDESLRERHFGSWQGVPRDELPTRDPERWSRFARQEDVVGEVGGESNDELVRRVVPSFRRHATAARTAVVVTHGGPVWHGVHALLGLADAVLGPVANASVATVDVDDGRAHLVGWNAVGHMPPSLRTTWRRPVHATDDRDARRREPASAGGDGIT